LKPYQQNDSSGDCHSFNSVSQRDDSLGVHGQGLGQHEVVVPLQQLGEGVIQDSVDYQLLVSEIRFMSIVNLIESMKHNFYQNFNKNDCRLFAA
jgi:hypothetical protein